MIKSLTVNKDSEKSVILKATMKIIPLKKMWLMNCFFKKYIPEATNTDKAIKIAPSKNTPSKVRFLEIIRTFELC